jgi:hypothetical protein
MMPFYRGNKTRPWINVTNCAKTFNWLFDTGAAVTCMSADSFRDSFKTGKPKLIRKDHCCQSANGSKMHSLGVFEVPLTIPGQKFVHPVAFMEDLKDFVIGINFMHANKMN